MATLDELVDDLFARSADLGTSHGLVIQRGGEIIAERYGVKAANLFESNDTMITAESTLVSWSMAKSITHAAVGVLVSDGALDVGAPAEVPEWAGTPKASITLLDLLEMRSGLHFIEDYVDDETSNCIEMLFGRSGPSLRPMPPANRSTTGRARSGTTRRARPTSSAASSATSSMVPPTARPPSGRRRCAGSSPNASSTRPR